MNHPTDLRRGASKLLTLGVLLGLLAALVAGGPARAQTPTRIIFLHHSCGENLINQGGVREGLTARGHEFWDHGYNGEGLRRADGSYTGSNFDVPGDNTDPDGFAAIFSQPLHDPPDNTFSHLMQYDVIAFKSCFPTSNIGDDEQLNQYKSYYRTIRDRIDQYPSKLFIIVTQPPQVPGASTPDEARRARAWTRWLQSNEYLAGHPNVVVFDFFGYLAGPDDFLRPEYRESNEDAHPNERANRAIGPIFVDFIDQAIRGFQGGGPRPTQAPAQPTIAPTQPTVPATPATHSPPAAAGLIEDFESGVDRWSANMDGDGSSVTRDADNSTAHSGSASMRIRYQVVAGGWGGCDRAFDAPQNWTSGAGLSLWLRADQAGQTFNLIVFAGDPNSPTPFETYFQTTAESVAGWAQFTFPWADFARAEWADAGGLAELDPTQVTSIAIGFVEGSQGTLWVDDVGLIAGGTQPPAATAPAPTSAPPSPTQPSGRGPTCPSPAVILPLFGAIAILLLRWRR